MVPILTSGAGLGHFPFSRRSYGKQEGIKESMPGPSSVYSGHSQNTPYEAHPKDQMPSEYRGIRFLDAGVTDNFGSHTWVLETKLSYATRALHYFNHSTF